MILSKRPHLMIRKLSEMLLPKTRSTSITPEDNNTASPRSPLDLNFPSPGNSKRYDSGGVGLGIVAALEETSNRHEVLANHLIRYSNRLVPVTGVSFRCPEEEYTYVTSRDGSTKCNVTKVYYNDDKFELFEHTSENDRKPIVVEEPRAMKKQILMDSTEFLSSCSLCKKRLHGKDIYMYKGEIGFCSEECRSVQIMKDEIKEKCKSKITRNVDVSSSPYAGGESYSAGIFVF